jgi:hypothetical protein
MKRFPTLMIVLSMAPLLGGCGVPDLVAYGIKAIEHRQRDGAPQGDGQRTEAPSQTVSVQPDEPPAPQAAPLPGRSSVTAEELPPR